MFDSMPCTFDDHDRLEFLENDKRLCCVLTLLICMPNEPMPNDSLSAEQETYATFNHILFIQLLNYGYDCICLYYVLQILDLLCAWSNMTLKEHVSGENLSFTNHVGH
jgi:hypothetical protein